MFVGGFVTAEPQENANRDNDFLFDFDEWLRQHSGISWQNGEAIILFQAGDDRAGFDAFWPLFDEFTQTRAKWLQWQKRRWPGTIPQLTLEEMLLELRRRGNMYMSRRAIDRLVFFLRGFAFCLANRGDLSGHTLIRGFEDWVRCRYGMTSAHSAESIILLNSFDEVAAVDLFWHLFDEFSKSSSSTSGIS